MATVVDTARKGISIVVGAATGGGANAGWFGDGRDGALNVADGQTLALPVALDEGQIVKQYTSGYIGTGSLLTAANRCNGMVLLFTGDLTIKGTISMDKKAPLLNPMEEQCAAEPHVALCGGLTGGNGGGGSTIIPSSYGDGQPGIGGNGFALGGGYGGGGGARLYDSMITPQKGGDAEPRAPIGTVIPFYGEITGALYGAGGAGLYRNYSGDYVGQGGSMPGGSGGYAGYDSPNVVQLRGNDGDAYGGGLLIIYVKGRLIISGSGKITANGGNGANGLNGGHKTPAGGAAGGGIIAIVHNGDYTNSGSVAANGGTGGVGYEPSRYTNGANGSIGTVLITTLSDLLAA